MYRVSQSWELWSGMREDDVKVSVPAGGNTYLYLCKPKRQAGCQNKNYGIESFKQCSRAESWIRESGTSPKTSDCLLCQKCRLVKHLI